MKYTIIIKTTNNETIIINVEKRTKIIEEYINFREQFNYLNENKNQIEEAIILKIDDLGKASYYKKIK